MFKNEDLNDYTYQQNLILHQDLFARDKPTFDLAVKELKRIQNSYTKRLCGNSQVGFNVRY